MNESTDETYQSGRFRLDIDLGNEVMKSPEDVARQLETIAEQICERHDLGGVICDDNGNSVGFWELI